MNEDYEWLIRVISSCKTKFQVIGCEKLIKFFGNKYSNEKTLALYLRNLWEELRIQKKAFAIPYESEFAG